MKLFASTEKIINITNNGENVPRFEVVEVVLMQCNLVDNQYQKNSELLYTFTRKCRTKYFSVFKNIEH